MTARLAVIVAAATIGLAACGGGSSSPQVASLPTSSGSGYTTSTPTGAASTAPPKGNATKLVDEWGACMRSHGDANQADPTIDTNKVIHISWNPAIPGGYNGTNKGGQGNSGPGQYCRAYLNAASTALQGGEREKPPDHETMVRFSRCMRASGIPDFPDPTASGLVMSIHPGTDLDPSSPAFQSAAKDRSRKTGAPALFTGTPMPGTVELNGGGPLGG
ncbi:MAG TPA: hypothetical protein VKT31_12545 [Solirubrobacteraceae bacterium]|nr:hypothetical protein [Solirubrobacteraceae bacterium]